MSSKVEVLCPNGHRVNIKMTQNTKVLQILEEACKKQGFLPPSDYELKHGRRTLDVTLTVRYAAIPNLGKLELVKAAKSRTESEVIIALQLPSGERIQHNFNPDTTVWEILVHWESQPESPHAAPLTKCKEDNQHPVCIYMREEVVGQYAMQNTSLRSLGLTGGKAMFRLLQRTVTPDVLNKIKEKIDQEKLRQDKIAAKSVEKQKDSSSIVRTERTINPIKEEQSSSSQPTSVQDCATAIAGVSNEDQEKSSKERTRELLFPQGARPKTQASGSSNKTPTAAMLFIPSVDSQPPTERDIVHLTPEQEAIAESLAQAISPSMMQQRDTAERAKLREERIKSNPKPAKRQQKLPQLPFAEFKFPESSKGQNLYQNELSDVNKEDFKPCDRETVIYKLNEKDETSEPMETEELPDDFFEVNEKDVKNMWSDLQQQLKEMDQQPLMTNAMKLAAKETRMSKYERTIIRFFFPQQVVVQALFRPRETVHTLYKFVKEYLEDKTTNFYLYTTPPKCVLKDRSATMIEANLSPMSVVYFGSESKLESYISSAVTEETSAESEAYEILVKYMPKATPSVASPKDPATARQSSTRSAASFQSGKVPKWFKIGKR